FIWAYGNTKELSLPLHYAWRIVNLIQSLIFFATLLAALPESKANFLELGSDIVWICGGFYIILKVNFISFYANDIDVIVDDLTYLTFICALGDMVTQQSQEVAMAAYDIYEHAPNSKEVQLDIGFMMYRAQEPLQIGAPPFPPFNLISNMAIAKRGDPGIYKFTVFMLLSLAYLSFVCTLGDMVTQQSQEVAEVAYHIYEFAPNSKEVQLDIGFMIYRAQKALEFCAPPFPPFNFISNMAVLKQCYTILTVLQETLE
ncbi:Or65b, partial [Drosophila busckii]